MGQVFFNWLVGWLVGWLVDANIWETKRDGTDPLVRPVRRPHEPSSGSFEPLLAAVMRTNGRASINHRQWQPDNESASNDRT